MKHNNLKNLFFCMLSLFVSHPLLSEVGIVAQGQSVWNVSKRVGQEIDLIESKVDIIALEVSINDSLISSQLDVVESKLDSIANATILTSDDIAGGTITISTAGNYCLGEDVTANITLSVSGVALDLSGRTVTGVVAITSFDDFILENGYISPPAPTGGSAVGITIINSNRVVLRYLVVKCADSAGVGAAGRSALNFSSGSGLLVRDCTFIAGAASDTTGSTGAVGGHACIMGTNSTYSVVLERCIMAGGDGGSASAAGATGGIGGVGLTFGFSDNLVVKDCTVIKSGRGGDGDPGSGTGGNGGAGYSGNGVDCVICCCIIRNTGAGGNGATPGVGGVAMFDSSFHSSFKTSIYSNYAHNIEGVLKFSLRNEGVEKGIQSPNPPDSTVLNSFANVYTTP